MPIRFRSRILDHLAHDAYRPAVARDVAREMQVEPDDLRAFEAAVEQLAAVGRIEIGSDDRLRLPSYGDEAEGTIRITARGFGFLVPEAPVREGELAEANGRIRRSGQWYDGVREDAARRVGEK